MFAGRFLPVSWLVYRQHEFTFSRSLLIFAFCLLPFAFTSGCRQDMHDQPKYEPLEPINDIGSITDGRASRPAVEGTVARGSLDNDPYVLAARSGATASNNQQVAQTAEGQAAQGQTDQGQTGQGFLIRFLSP